VGFPLPSKASARFIIHLVPATVLIVDDEPRFRSHARRLLRLRGFEVAGEAWDAASARRLTWSLRPDAVLLDINLPDASGLDLACELTAIADPPRVLLISAEFRPDERIVEDCRAVAFVAKDELPGSDLWAILQRPGQADV
jgi:DNA-binding NarL/FixJ family response regulator